MLRSIKLLSVVIALLNFTPCFHTWLQGPWLDPDPVKRTRLRPELSYKHRIPRLRTNGSSPEETTAILSILHSAYNFTLPAVQLRRSLVYTGQSARLRRLLTALIRNEQRVIKIAVIGGSISWGHGSSVRGQTDWFTVFSKWLISTFPRANITARNGCTPGVPTPYMIMCLELSVDPDVDLVFMEYTLNDGYSLRQQRDNDEAMLFGNRIVMDSERLIRRILALPHSPAVVFMHSPTDGTANYPYGHPKNPNRTPYRGFFQTSEDIQGALSQYYDVQYMSLRTALYRLAVKEQPGFKWEDVFMDHHPGDHGHKMMADLAVHLIQRTALGLLMEPYDREDAEAAVEPLPPPMYQNNLPPNSTMCSAGEAFRSLAVLSEGWEYINEGTAEKPKPGFVATAPSSRLQLRLDTQRSVDAPGSEAAQSTVGVYLHHLRSYMHMGVAKISCVSGCSCPEVAVDAHISKQMSQVFLARVDATQSRECLVQVTVLNQTSSGEHKFKVSGVVVAEEPGTGKGVAGLGADHGSEFGLQVHVDLVEQLKIASQSTGNS